MQKTNLKLILKIKLLKKLIQLIISNFNLIIIYVLRNSSKIVFFKNKYDG